MKFTKVELIKIQDKFAIRKTIFFFYREYLSNCDSYWWSETQRYVKRWCLFNSEAKAEKHYNSIKNTQDFFKKIEVIKRLN